MTSTLKRKDMPRVRNRIRRVREELNIEANTLALNTGINYRGLLNMEANKQPITLDQLGAVANFFKVELQSLIESPENHNPESAFVSVSDAEKEIINYYRQLDPGMKKYLENVLRHAASFEAMNNMCKYITSMNASQIETLETTAKVLSITSGKDQEDIKKLP